jgi:hypothetical protein
MVLSIRGRTREIRPVSALISVTSYSPPGF